MRHFQIKVCCKAIPILWLLILGHTSCTKEDLEECRKPLIEIQAQLQVDSQEDTALDTTIIKGVDVYFFDQDNRLVDHSRMAFGERRTLNFPLYSQIKVVALGRDTTERDPFEVSNYPIGSSFSDYSVRLKESRQERGLLAEKALSTFSEHATDMVFGIFPIVFTPQLLGQKVIVLPVKRKVAAMNITTVRMQTFFRIFDDEFYFIIKETYSGIDFSGNYKGAFTRYKATGKSMPDGKLFKVDNFFLFPSSNNVPFEVELHHPQEGLLYTVRTDQQGNLLESPAGKTLNLLIDFSDSDQRLVAVTVKQTEWGVIEHWKFFD